MVDSDRYKNDIVKLTPAAIEFNSLELLVIYTYALKRPKDPVETF